MELMQMRDWMMREWDNRPFHAHMDFFKQPVCTIDEAAMFRGNEPVNITMHWHIPADHPRPHAHNHEFFEIIYVAHGQFIHEMPDRTLAQPPDTLLLMSPGAIHDVHTEGPDDMVFNIKLRKPIVENTLQRLVPPNHELGRFFRRALYGSDECGPHLSFAISAPLRERLERFITDYYEHQPDYFTLMAHMLGIFSELAALCQPTAPVKAPLTPDQILRYIRDNCASVTLETVAEHFNYSTRQIARILRQSADTSFTKYLNTCRIERVLTLVNDAHLPITAAIERAGFTDDSYFYSVFKRVTGKSFKSHKASAG